MVYRYDREALNHISITLSQLRERITHPSLTPDLDTLFNKVFALLVQSTQRTIISEVEFAELHSVWSDFLKKLSQDDRNNPELKPLLLKIAVNLNQIKLAKLQEEQSIFDVGYLVYPKQFLRIFFKTIIEKTPNESIRDQFNQSAKQIHSLLDQQDYISAVYAVYQLKVNIVAIAGERAWEEALSLKTGLSGRFETLGTANALLIKFHEYMSSLLEKQLNDNRHKFDCASGALAYVKSFYVKIYKVAALRHFSSLLLDIGDLEGAFRPEHIENIIEDIEMQRYREAFAKVVNLSQSLNNFDITLLNESNILCEPFANHWRELKEWLTVLISEQEKMQASSYSNTATQRFHPPAPSESEEDAELAEAFKMSLQMEQ